MLVSLCVAEAVLFVNTTAFNLALPSVARSFNASTAEQQGLYLFIHYASWRCCLSLVSLVT